MSAENKSTTKTVDKKVVEMRFDNSNFEKNVQKTMSTVDKLKAKLNFKGANKGINELQNGVNKVSFSHMESSLAALERRFSTMGVAGMTVIQNLTNSLMSYAHRLSNFITGGIIQGGITRATNLENARFQLKGLLKDASAVEDVMVDVNYGVQDTAYSLDAAAKVAAQLAASGMTAGENMRKALRGISGVAAMTNSTYEDIGNVYTTVAGNGRLMGDQLLQLSTRGLNAAATLGKQLGKTEAEIREMVSKGKIDFQTFANAMDDAFGEHAKEANKTLQGVMSNIRAALAKVGAEFINPIIANEGPLVEFLNAIREKVNDIKGYLIPLANAITPKIGNMFVKWADGIKKLDMTPLNNFINKVINFINTFKTDEKVMKNIKDGLGGFGHILSILINLLKQLIKTLIDLGKHLTPLGKGLAFIFGVIGRGLAYIDAWVKKNKVFERIFSVISNAIKKVYDSIRYFVKDVLKFENVLDFLKGLFGIMAKLLGSLANAFANFIKRGDVKRFMDLFNTGLMAVLINTFTKLINTLRGITKAVKSASSILFQVKKVLKAYQNEINAKAIKQIALSFAILVGAIWVLSGINAEGLTKAVGAMSVLMVELMLCFKAMTAIGNKQKILTRTSLALVSLSLSLLILSVAMKKLADLSLGDLAKSLVGIGIAMQMFVKAVKALPDDGHTKKKTKGLITLSLSLLILSVALKKIGSMSVTEIVKSLIVMALSLQILTKTINKIESKGAIAKSISLLILANSLLILAAGLKLLGMLRWDEIGRGLVSMAGALLILVTAMNVLGKDTSSIKLIAKSASLIGATLSLIVLAGAMKILGTMSWSDIARSLTAMGGALSLLVAAIKILGSSAKTALIGSAALIIMANSLILFGIGMKILGSMNWETIIKSLIGLASVLTILGVGALLLKPLAPTLLAIAGAAALFGVAAVAIGVGLSLIAVGITALATALSGGATIIVSGVVAIIKGLIGAVGDIVLLLKGIIVGLLKAVIEIAPLLAKAIGTLLLETAKMLKGYVPEVTEILLEMIISVIRVLTRRVPELIVSFAELIQAIFHGFMEAMEVLDSKTLINGLMGLGLITGILIALAHLAALTPMAAVGVIALGLLVAELSFVLSTIGELKGLAQSISDSGPILQAIGTAIGQFVGGLIGGFGKGLSSAMPDIATNLSKFMENLQPFLNAIKMVNPDLAIRTAALAAGIMVLAGAQITTGFAKLITFGSKLSDLGKELSDFIKNAKPFIDEAIILNPTMMRGIKALADSILVLSAANFVKGLTRLTSWITGDNSLSKFGKEIASLGKGMRQFADNLGTFNDAQTNSIKFAANAILALATASKKIPNEGGLWSWIAGDNSLSKFSGYLPNLGKNLNEFVKNLGEFNQKQIGTIKACGESIVALAEASKKIPNEGGIWSWLAGDNSIGKFSEYLPKVGACLSLMAKNLSSFSEKDSLAIKNAGLAIAGLAEAANKIPNTGGMVSWFTGDNDISKFADKLPGVGQHLTKFVQSVNGIDSKGSEKAKTAAEVIGALCTSASKIPNTGGLVSLFTGDNDITLFAFKLPIVGRMLSSFVKTLTEGGKFDESTISTVDCAAKALKALASAASDIPNTGGLAQLFTGESDISKFANKLPAVGQALVGFVSSLTSNGTFDDATTHTIECAGNALKALSGAASSLPKEDGLWQAIAGKQSLASFSDKLPKVGTAISGFVKNLVSDGEFSDQKVTTINCACDALKALASVSKSFPKTGGVWQWLSGENDVSKYASKFPQVAEGIKGFCDKIGTFKEDKIASINAAVGALKALAKVDDINFKNLKNNSGTLSTVGQNMSTFISKMAKTSEKTTATAKTNCESFVQMVSSFSSINGDNIVKIADGLKQIGTTGVDDFINSLSGADPKTKVVDAISDLIDELIRGAEIKRQSIIDKFDSLARAAIKALKETQLLTDIRGAGKNFAQGFANGITDNQYLAVNAGSELGDAAYRAAKRAIDAHSPSKKAYKLGDYFGVGFVNGIHNNISSVYNESKNMGEQAKIGLTKAISTINNILNNDNMSEPTIKPVLDLSSVEMGANRVNDLFNDINIGTNLNAISVGMIKAGQNGTNDDVVSAINKLGNAISGYSGDTYNINGVNYNDDTAVSDAVRTLIRAANIERRI